MVVFTMKIQKTIFVFLFCTLLLLPIIKFDAKSEISKKENRKLAVFPALFETSTVNWKYFSQINDYLQDRFGFRNELININTKIQYEVLGRRGNSRALFGKDGWIFYIDPNYGNNYADFMKQNLVDKQTVEKFVKELKTRADWCKQNGIQFIFVLTPNKHSVYPEFYPFDRPEGITRADQFVGELKKTDVNYIFPRDLLVSKKGDLYLYYKTDTHWDDLGAFMVFNEIKKEVKSVLPKYSLPDYSFDVKIKNIPGTGDLVPMLGLDSYGEIQQISYKPKDLRWSDIYTYEKNQKRDGVLTTGKNQKLPKAIIFRDSFFINLEPFTSTLFSKADYIWKSFETTDKDYILKNKPDIIIWEIVEKWSESITKMDWR